MKEFKVAKDKWRVRELNNRKLIYRFYIYSGSENIISSLRTDYPNVKVGKANAQLIATAPELLDALLDLVQIVDDGDVNKYSTEYAKKVINKALNIEP